MFFPEIDGMFVFFNQCFSFGWIWVASKKGLKSWTRNMPSQKMLLSNGYSVDWYRMPINLIMPFFINWWWKHSGCYHLCAHQSSVKIGATNVYRFRRVFSSDQMLIFFSQILPQLINFSFTSLKVIQLTVSLKLILFRLLSCSKKDFTHISQCSISSFPIFFVFVQIIWIGFFYISFPMPKYLLKD